MSEPQGTIQLLGLALSEVLAPLKRDLEPGQARLLLHELGIHITEEQEISLSGPLLTTVTNISEMITLAGNLTEALESDDLPAIGQISVTLISRIKNSVQSFSELKNSLEALNVPGISSSVIQDFPQNIFNHLLAKRLGSIRGLNELLEFLHVLERVVENENATDPNNPQYEKAIFHARNMTKWISNPAAQMQLFYGWHDNNIDEIALFGKLEQLALALGASAFFDESSTPPGLDFAIAGLVAKTDIVPVGIELLLRAGVNAGELSIALDEEMAFALKSDFDLSFGSGILFQPDGNLMLISPAGELGPSNRIILLFEADRLLNPDKYILIGQIGGSRLEIGKVSLQAEMEIKGEEIDTGFPGVFRFSGKLEGGILALDLSDSDSFLHSFFSSTNFRSEFDLEFGYSSKDGLFFSGSSSLTIQIPVHVELGPVQITAISFDVAIQDEAFPLSVSANFKTALGPVQASIKGIGLTAILEFKDDHSGNLGPLDFSLAFKPPNGIGLSIDGGGFKGGGFLDFEPEFGRYSGMLELEFQDSFSLKAIGLLTTRLPNGQEGFSLLILITSEFTPVQLGFGFTLNGIGGLLGLNRTVKTERLRTGLRDNTLNSILFPTNIIANAERIISDLRQVFPPQEGRFVFGPMARIGWGTPTLITVDLGLLIEVPDPVRLVILGVLKGLLPNEDTAILRIQVNFLGVINFEKEQLSFDASLFDSTLLAFTLSGDMAIRLYWGATPNFLLTVGGFHPAYEPPPMNLPAIRRLTLQLLEGDNPRLRMETYFAVTSNTVQFGSRVELYAAAWKFNVFGFLSFDVLFQFNPFYFVAEVSAMLDLRVGTSSIASIKLELTLEGPTPWKVKGSAKLRLCWFLTVKVRFSKTFGEQRNTRLPDIAVLPLLVGALSARDNWEGELPASRHRLVSLKEVGGLNPEDILVHPVGTLRISQKLVPLNLRIDKLGSQQPGDARTFRIGAVEVAGSGSGSSPVDVQESFAPAQFFEMKDAEKLASPSFKEFDSGIRIGEPDALQTAYAAAREVKYELKYIDSQRDRRLAGHAGVFDLDPVIFNAWTLQGAIAQSDLSFARSRQSTLAPEAVTMVQEPFAIVNRSDLQLFDAVSLMGSEQAALVRINELIETHPALRGKLQVVPGFEING